MNMNNIYVNELSLHGQYNSWEQFLMQNDKFIRTLRWIKNNKEHYELYKKTELYCSFVTKDEKLYEIRGKKFQLENNDKARLLKSLLLSLQNDPPYWDSGEIAQNGIYHVNGRDISGSSIAEAAQAGQYLLSFADQEYIDKVLVVLHELEKLRVPSIFSFAYLSKMLYESGSIDINEYVKRFYAGTRLEFGKIEQEYGLQYLEKEEVDDCLRNFDRFVSHENWDNILKDNSLVYKAYTPSQKEKAWFRNSKYKDMKIDKFRCVNPKRCFGYREGDKFIVLRIERDHKISDNG